MSGLNLSSESPSRMDVRPGDTIYQCVRNALGLARMFSCQVEFVFNDVPIVVGRWMQEQDILDGYFGSKTAGEKLKQSMAKELAKARMEYSVEAHGNGYAIYVGRDMGHHGYNVAHLTEIDPKATTLLADIEMGLNLVAELRARAQLQREGGPDGVLATLGNALVDVVAAPQGGDHG